jgi:hypothetical protein
MNCAPFQPFRSQAPGKAKSTPPGLEIEKFPPVKKKIFLLMYGRPSLLSKYRILLNSHLQYLWQTLLIFDISV